MPDTSNLAITCPACSLPVEQGSFVFADEWLRLPFDGPYHVACYNRALEEKVEDLRSSAAAALCDNRQMAAECASWFFLFIAACVLLFVLGLYTSWLWLENAKLSGLVDSVRAAARGF